MLLQLGKWRLLLWLSGDMREWSRSECCASSRRMRSVVLKRSYLLRVSFEVVVDHDTILPHRPSRPSLDTIPLSATDRSLTSAYPQPESLTPSVPNMYRSASASSQSPLHTPQAGYDSEVGNGVRGYDFAADPRDGPYGGAIMGGQGGNQTGTTTSSSTSRVHYQEPADSNHPFNIAQTAQEQRYTTVPLGPPSGAIENEKRGKKRNNGMFGGVFTKSSGESLMHVGILGFLVFGVEGDCARLSYNYEHIESRMLQVS